MTITLDIARSPSPTDSAKFCTSSEDESSIYSYGSQAQSQCTQAAAGVFSTKQKMNSPATVLRQRMSRQSQYQNDQNQMADFTEVPLDDKCTKPQAVASWSEMFENDVSDSTMYDYNLAAPTPNPRKFFDPEFSFSSSRPPVLPEKYRPNEFHDTQKFIDGVFEVRYDAPRQAYLKEMVNSSICEKRRPGRGGMVPREVYLRRTVNEEIKHRGARGRINEQIKAMGRSRFLKAQTVTELKQRWTKQRLMESLKQTFLVKRNVMRTNEQILYRRQCIRHIQRNPWLLDPGTAYDLIQHQINRNPKQTYLKLRINEELRERHEIPGIPKLTEEQEPLGKQFLRSCLHNEIVNRGRYKARRQQIQRLMQNRARKRTVLSQLKEQAEAKKLTELRRRINEHIESRGMEKRLSELIQHDQAQPILQGKSKSVPNYFQVCQPAWFTHLSQHTRNEIKEIVTTNLNSNGLQTTAKTTLIFQYGLNTRQLDEIVKYFNCKPRRKVHDIEATKVPLSENSIAFAQRFLQEREVEISPGPQEFFLRTLINNIVSKNRNRVQKKMWLLARHIAMPEQAYLKLKVNEVIRQIGYTKARTQQRELKSQINEVILTRGRKAAVNAQIKEHFVAKQKNESMVNVVLNKARMLNEIKTFKFKSLRSKEAHHMAIQMEIKQRNLKRMVVQEIKLAGLRNRCMKAIKTRGLKHELNKLNMKRGRIILDMAKMRGIQQQLAKLRRRRGQVILGMSCLDQVNKRVSTTRMLHATPPMSRQVFLKEEVLSSIKIRGLKQSINEQIKKIGHQRALKKGINQCIIAREMKRQLHLEIHQRQRQVILKSRVNQEIFQMGRIVRRNMAARKELLKQRLNELMTARGKVIVEMSAYKSLDRKDPEKKTFNSMIGDVVKLRMKMMKLKSAVNRDINVIGKAKMLKHHINQTIKTHGRKASVVQEIKTRGRSVRAKARVIQEIRERMVTVRAKERVNSEIKQRSMKVRCLRELKMYFYRRSITAKKSVYQRRKEKFAGRPVAHQMHLKMEINQYFKQRGLKALLVKEVRQRFRTVDLKHKLCKEVLMRAKRKLWHKQVRLVIRQRALKSACLPRIIDGDYLLKNVWRRAKTRTHQEMRSRVLKMKINNRIHQMALKAKLNTLKRRRSLVILEMAARKNDAPTVNENSWKNFSEELQKMTAKKTFKNNSVKNVYNTIYKQRNLRARAMKEILEIAKIKKAKRACLQELKMIRARQLVGIEIRRFGQQKLLKARLNLAIKMRGLKARICYRIRIRDHWLLDPVQRYIKQRQVYLKSKLTQQIALMGRRMRMMEELQQRGEHMKRRKHIDSVISTSKAKAKCCKLIKQIGNQQRLKSELIQEIKLRCLKNRVNRELLEFDMDSLNQVSKAVTWGQLEELQFEEPEFVSFVETPSDNIFGDDWDCDFDSSEGMSEVEFVSFEERPISEVNGEIKAIRTRNLIERMIAIRAKAVEAKSRVNLEIKQRGLKATCVYAIEKMGMWMKKKRWVCEEIKQRARFAHVVEDIKTRFYWLRPSEGFTEIPLTVMLKQELRRKQVLVDIKRRGTHFKILECIKQRGRVMALKNQCNKIIRQAGLKIDLNLEIRNDFVPGRFRDVNRKVAQNLAQRKIKARLNRAILDRSRQIYWKKQTCIIIAQGGRKIRVNRVIKDIGRQRFLKQQVNLLIKQGGLKAKVCREIRARGQVAMSKRKCNKAIKQIQKARLLKRRINTVIRQTGLKARVNHDIRRQRYRLKQALWKRPHREGESQKTSKQIKLEQLIESFRTRHQARAWWEMPESVTRGKDCNPLAPRMTPPNFSFSLNEIAPRPPTVAAELDHVTLNRPTIPSGNRRSRNKRKNEVSSRLEGETEEPETIRFQSKHNDMDSFLVESDLPFDDLDSPYGDAVSEQGIAVMKLVEKISSATEFNEHQNRDVRMLQAQLSQARMDFGKLNTRLVSDKFQLFEELDKLRKENSSLHQEVSMKEKRTGRQSQRESYHQQRVQNPVPAAGFAVY